MSEAEKNPLVLAVDLEFHGRYGFENEDQAAKRRVARNAAAASELRRLAAVEQELVAARKQMEAQKDEWLSWEAKRKSLEQAALELATLKRAISEAEPYRYYVPGHGPYEKGSVAESWSREDGIEVQPLYTLKGIK